MRQRLPLRIELLRPDGTRPHPRDRDFAPARTLEPHHVVLWAGRWYLVAYKPSTDAWEVIRIDRLHIVTTGTRTFPERDLPARSVRDMVMDEPDRGDTPAAWQCTGHAILDVPASIVARYCPGGSVVDPIDTRRTRLTLGAWSWAGIAGILATFDCTLTDVEPRELREAFRDLAQRAGAVEPPTDAAT